MSSSNFQILNKGFNLLEGMNHKHLNLRYRAPSPREWMHGDGMSNNDIEKAVEVLNQDEVNFTNSDKVTLLAFLNGIVDAKSVHQHGGEGEGDGYYNIYMFPNLDNMLVKFNGWYASYNGAEYSEMYEVVPVEVAVTQYNRL